MGGATRREGNVTEADLRRVRRKTVSADFAEPPPTPDPSPPRASRAGGRGALRRGLVHNPCTSILWIICLQRLTPFFPRTITHPSRSAKGRVASVIVTWSGCGGRYDAGPRDCVGSRKRSARLRGMTPATRADGPSACPGNSLHERGSVGRNDANRDMQQAAKSIRVRNAGEVPASAGGLPFRGEKERWPRRLLSRAAAALCFGTGRRVCRLRAGTPGAAGAVKRQAFRTPLKGETETERPTCLEVGLNTGR